MNTEANRETAWWRSRSGLALLGFAVIAGFFLLSEHRAHGFSFFKQQIRRDWRSIRNMSALF